MSLTLMRATHATAIRAKARSASSYSHAPPPSCPGLSRASTSSVPRQAAPHIADAHAGYSRDRHPGESAERVLALDVGAKRVFVFPRTTSVMPGLVPGIHVLRAAQRTWMAGTSPAMTRK